MTLEARPSLFGSLNGAVLDSTRAYRYLLWRTLNPEATHPRTLLWVMLNPSTADALTDDKTIRECRWFTARERFDRLEVVNLFAHRATQPSDLLTVADPVGPDNDETIALAAGRAQAVVIAWGVLRPRWRYRAVSVVRLLLDHHETVHTLGTTKDGFPRHPSRLPHTAPMTRLRVIE